MTAAEIASLWASYIQDSVGKYTLTYFLAKVEDEEVRPVVERALEVAKLRMHETEKFFTEEEFLAPDMFTDADVRTNAPRLYSDSFILYYIHGMGEVGLNSMSRGLTSAARPDIREYYTRSIIALTDLFNEATELLLHKGLYVRSPFVPGPEQLTYVRKQSYLGEIFKEPRPLNAAEIAFLWRNITTNVMGKAMLIGFSQVGESEELRRFMARGRDIASKHIEIFGKILRDQDVPSPITWDSEVTDNTEAPFSDKLMMYQTLAMISSGLGNYGMSMSVSTRRDVSLTYSRLMAEVAQFADDGTELLVKYGWMLQMPQAPNRNELARI